MLEREHILYTMFYIEHVEQNYIWHIETLRILITRILIQTI